MNKTNMMHFGEYTATVSYDPDIELFRGEFVGLNGSADFYADSIAKLKQEGEASLRVYLQMCKENGITPKKTYSGKFMARVPAELHQQLAELASAGGISINQLVTEVLSREVRRT